MSDLDLSEADAQAPRLMYSVEAAAELLSMSRTRMFALIKSGAIRSIRVGRLRRIPAEALVEYVDHLFSTQSESRHEGRI